MARATLYIPDEHPAAVLALARMAKTQLEIAEALGIHITTFKVWLNEHPEFKANYVLGLEDAVDRTERSLFERANGYSHVSEKLFMFGGEVIRAETVEHYPPDPVSLKLFLTNKRAKDWKERNTQEHTGPGGGPIQVITGVPE